MLKAFSSYPLLTSFMLGVVAVLGFAPFYLFPVTIFSLMGLFILWQKTSATKQAVLIGFGYGLGLFIAGIYWIYISLHTFGGMPWWMAGLATFLLCAFLSMFPAIVGYFSSRFSMHWLAMPVFWTISEWVRSWIFTGFPWLAMGYSQVPNSLLVGLMPIVGVYGVTLMVTLIASLIAYWVARPVSVLWVRNVIGAIVVVLITSGVLRAIPWTMPIGPQLTVALLQGNIAQDIKWSPEMAEETIQRYLVMLKQSQAQLVILPETALPVIQQNLSAERIRLLQSHMQQQQGDVLVGIVELEDEKYFNSVLSYGVSPPQVYRKSHLVPFGEFIPLKALLGWIYRDWLNMPLSDLSRGGKQTPMHVAGQKVAVNICYEDVFGEEIIHQLPSATLLVNVSNDAWYGQSTASYQHMQISQARAIETGRMMLRATNTGATAIIDINGHVLAHAPHDVQTIITGKAQGYTGSTLYVRWGNGLVLVLLLILLGYLVIIKKRERL